MSEIRDVDIRRRLVAEVRRLHESEPDTLILHEVGLCQGAVRVDLAVVNGSFNGYEIKSEADTLARLPGQRAVYSRTLDFVTIVTCDKHTKAARQAVPRWWGIWSALSTEQGLALREIRTPSRNPRLDARAVAELLWREEALEELEKLGAANGLRSKPRPVLWERLSSELPIDELRAIVRRRLKTRGERWRSTPGPPA
jgi:hypothetical protein